MTSAGFNRRMRKTACPVVWKGHGVQLPVPPSDQPIRPTVAAPAGRGGCFIRMLSISRQAAPARISAPTSAGGLFLAELRAGQNGKCTFFEDFRIENFWRNPKSAN